MSKQLFMTQVEVDRLSLTLGNLAERFVALTTLQRAQCIGELTGHPVKENVVEVPAVRFTLSKVAHFLSSSYKQGSNPLPTLRTRYPNFVWSYVSLFGGHFQTERESVRHDELEQGFQYKFEVEVHTFVYAERSEGSPSQRIHYTFGQEIDPNNQDSCRREGIVLLTEKVLRQPEFL